MEKNPTTWPKRSKATGELHEFITKKQIGIVLEIPQWGTVRLRGELLREFLWTLRRHGGREIFEVWYDKLIDQLKLVRSNVTIGQTEAEKAQGADNGNQA